MKKLTITIILLLTGCGGLPKAGPQAALYDFGITPNETPIATPQLRLAGIEAAPSLDGNDMRYRLAYQNPARVFAYTESRWVAPPDKLLARRFAQRLQPTSSAPQCALHVTLEIFDQIFDTPDSSRGIVRFHASLTDGAGRHAASRTMLASAERSAATADARGGVAALTAAADDAFAQIIDWARGQACGTKEKS
ncbi:MAG: hypothetical protein A3B82_06275 [Methylophilales bacterium RIFCSPHIGHO2_02_FULL_57_10]|nr:MAG: hypothetical protein A3B82_06275 [Methylophilales bacterium RIFCSPHIGHO2_02_FULL_57_10]